MTDFVTRLAQRQLGQLPVVEPRVAAMYGPAVQEASVHMTIDDAGHRPMPHPESEMIPKSDRSRTRDMRSEPDGRRGPSGREPVVGPEPLMRKYPMAVAPDTAPEPGRIRGNDDPPKDIPRPLPMRPRAQDPSTDRLPVAEPRSMAKGSSAVAERLIAPTVLAALVSPNPLTDGIASASGCPPERPSAPSSLGTPRQTAEYLRRDTPDTAEPPVHVTIGRIEVTAVTAAPAPKRTPPRRSSMSLEDYLARRERRER